MRKNILYTTLFVLVFTLLVGIVAAQDATEEPMMMEGEKVVCDSTTILLLYIAEYDYGYEPMMDVSGFEKGQYTPLFEAMMMMEEEMMDDEDMMATEEAMMDDHEDDMMMLSPAAVEGEDAACTELRASVEDFLYHAVSEEMMMMEEESE